MDKNKYYKTNAFYLATFLLAKDFLLVSTERTSANKLIFVFENTDKLQELVRIFNFGEINHVSLKVNFKKIEAAIKKLKSLIYD
ncbi:hypothetical protein A2303_02010 [Candidatus Falkowbacteria bacterium RIFOXYB2_FULL_47_14]|uniref:DUF5659 domain-containing protein n=1 Tax=Candidatus Falkowbacteria bacterium RIFOXYA2_FULL_47_19 TaxID=1797994 RepID=A0A1F5SNP4_9BACT|nr:MAG: hypothetical protein A2227_06680 [Candidatus Falkowbacteria bacterium RIFOXYA2_FULL_47_19]OGF34607.1 MAG: hypothetical protein A2468_07915 [Candidatus Falkowbacteria bacterium RIFOXYC2_FULL_46_15]OGF43226.1 MAG: hypothetical protein A2303_02010 [Candidatus Falkowbacteria bacterium RIFOXYB2_FULL_47_14]